MKFPIRKTLKLLFYTALPLATVILWVRQEQMEDQLQYANWKTNQNTRALCHLLVDELCREYKLTWRSYGSSSTEGDAEWHYCLIPAEGYDAATHERLVQAVTTSPTWLIREFAATYNQPPHLQFEIRLADGQRENETAGELIIRQESRRNPDGSPRGM